MNNIDNLISGLRTKKGYYNNGRLKKGKAWLAKHYNVSIQDVDNAINILKNISNTSFGDILNEISASKPKNKVVKNNNIMNYWVAGCMHLPFHNKKQLASTLNYLKTIQLDGIILAGDILDINSLSFHDKGKVPIEGVTLDWEYREANKAFKAIQKLVEEKKISSDNLHFMYGNHEDRYLRTLKLVDQSKYGKALMSPEVGLNLIKRGWKIYKDYQRDFIILGDLHINHGEYLNQHVAKKTIDVYKQSSLFFHTHRFQIYSENKFIGYNMGFSGDINSKVFNYAPRGAKSLWTNASALVTVINGKSHVQPLMFINDKLIINGKEY